MVSTFSMIDAVSDLEISDLTVDASTIVMDCSERAVSIPGVTRGASFSDPGERVLDAERVVDAERDSSRRRLSLFDFFSESSSLESPSKASWIASPTSSTTSWTPLTNRLIPRKIDIVKKIIRGMLEVTLTATLLRGGRSDRT